MVAKEKEIELLERMIRLGIKDDDLIEKFILGSGSGGQKINKTSSCVYLKHLPSGIEIKCQRDRSREMNRFLARRELCEKLEYTLFQQKSKKQQEISKLRRQKQRRSRRTKLKQIEEKRGTSTKKSFRKPVKENHES